MCVIYGTNCIVFYHTVSYNTQTRQSQDYQEFIELGHTGESRNLHACTFLFKHPLKNKNALVEYYLNLPFFLALQNGNMMLNIPQNSPQSMLNGFPDP